MAEQVVGGRDALVEHVADEVQSPARGFELLARGDVGRARGQAEAAVDAVLQVGERRLVLADESNRRAYGWRHTCSCQRPGLRVPRGSNSCFSALTSVGSDGSKGSTARRRSAGPDST